MPLSDSHLQDLYCRDGLNDYQVARLLGVSRNTLRAWRQAHGIPSKTNKKGLNVEVCSEVNLRLNAGETLTNIAKDFGVKRTSLARLMRKQSYVLPVYRAANPAWTREYQLTDVQAQVLLGELFGDGGVVATSQYAAYYQCGHALGQKFFVEWKAAVFQPLTSRFAVSLDRDTVTMGTWTCPALASYRKAFYPSGSGDKVLTGSLARNMTPLALAVWFMGDGSRNGNTGVFHVGLAIDLPPIAEVLSDLFDLRFTARRYAREWHLRVMEPEKFFPLIAPFLLPSFGYKVPPAYRTLVGNQQPSLEGNLSEGSTTRPMPKALTGHGGKPRPTRTDAGHPILVG